MKNTEKTREAIRACIRDAKTMQAYAAQYRARGMERNAKISEEFAEEFTRRAVEYAASLKWREILASV